jgi:hypothetical protein
MTLKNAMNAGEYLVNVQGTERLELTTKWAMSYQHFDGVLRHLDGTNQEIAQVRLNGLYETFTAVFAYAQDHGFADDWQVQTPPMAQTVATISDTETY